MKPVRIVYIDDDEEDIFIFRQHIKRISTYKIDFIPILRIDKEIDKFFKMDFSLIFLDYHLINTTGIEVLSALRSFGINTPIILLTDVMMDRNSHAELISLGSSDYIIKSKFDAAILEKVINNLYNSKKYTPVNREYKSINILQVLFFHNDGRLIYSSVIKDGKLHLWGGERESPTLFSASLYIINTYIREMTGLDSPFQEMKSNDLFITSDRGENLGICIISENSCQNIQPIFSKIIFDIEKNYHNILQNWNGNLQLLDFQPYLEKLQAYVVK